MAFATALVINLSTGEHKVTEPLPGRYAVHDPQFQRTMGALFSSPLEDGNLAEDFQKDGGSDSVRLMYLLSIAASRQSILIANAYFVPDDLSVKELVAARGRGVTVKIIVPGDQIDTDVVRHASRSRWRPLLAAGVEIYEYLPTMYHCKYMIVDGIWTTVGSTNFDNRSFRLNDEANANIYDHAFAAGQELVFRTDLAHSRQVTLEQFDARPASEKALDSLAGLLRSQL